MAGTNRNLCVKDEYPSDKELPQSLLSSASSILKTHEENRWRLPPYRKVQLRQTLGTTNGSLPMLLGWEKFTKEDKVERSNEKWEEKLRRN
ncbi:unnamed protein product [Prunus brigantina]